MDLGAYTFAQLPGAMTMIRADIPQASVETYSSVAVFAWDATIVGKVLTLSWNAMTSSQFSSMDAIYQAGASVVFDPTSYIGSTTYNVQVMSLSGEYWAGISAYRLNVEINLLILSVVP